MSLLNFLANLYYFVYMMIRKLIIYLSMDTTCIEGKMGPLFI